MLSPSVEVRHRSVVALLRAAHSSRRRSASSALREPGRTSLRGSSFVRVIRPHHVVLLAIGCSVLGLAACKKPIQKQQTEGNIAARDSALAAEDTSQSEVSRQFDSLKNKVTGFLSSLLPPKQDTSKGHPVFSAPPPGEEQNPTVQVTPPSSEGFLPDPVKRRVEFDANGNVVQRDVFLGGDVRDPLQMSFNDYLHAREEDELTRAFRASLHRQQDTGKTVEPTTGILGDYNNISIPIPPSIVPTIFGRPSINLRVSGDVAVHLAYRDNETFATSGVNFIGSETGLDFKQEINVSTNGTIGDKLKIGADWGSERMFQFDNLLKLGYTGFPDEILQSFEAGNVNLTTPSQYIGTQQALFGLKAVTRFGPAYVTLLAAQKKAERQTKTFGGGTGVMTEHVIKPWEYRRNQFFLDTSFRRNYEIYYSTIPANADNVTKRGLDYLTSNDSMSIDVWVSTNNATEVNQHAAVAWYNLPPLVGSARYDNAYRNINATSDTLFSGRFVKLAPNRYRVDQYTGILILNQEPNDEQVLAVSYRSTRGQFGELGDAGSDPVVLKLIKPVRLFQRPRVAGWDNLLKNTYYVGGQGFDPSTFTGRIIYQRPDGHQVEYVRSATKPVRSISEMGLDRYNNSNPSDASPDGQIDVMQNSYIVDKQSGTLMFPYLEPFGSHQQAFWAQQAGNANYQRDSNFYLPEVYNQVQDVLRRDTKQVTINVKYSGGVSSTLQLGAFNLVEGSVKVTINGTPLVEREDFRVDYNSGTVTILRPDLINTGTISVDYDVHDIFTNATKNVLGFRTEVPLGDKGVIGTSLMNYAMHLPTLKTRQGEEPLSNWIWGVDANYKVDAPFLTDALNFLPFFNLKEKSELAVRADAALSLPNPNTEASPIPDDQGKSIAYLDDFEGGKNEFPLYMSYGRWVPASQPLDSEYLQKYLTEALYDSMVNRLKGKTWWYEPTGIAIRDIKPNKEVVHAGDPAQVLAVYFDPTRPGIYNPYPLKNGVDITDTDRWGGMMQYAPGLNVPATNTDAIEVWVNVTDINQDDLAHGVMRLDLGRISEDIIPDKKLETEDINNNGRYDPGEDRGLMMLPPDSEKILYPFAWNPDDPLNDDYNYTNGSTNFESINGQAGNETDAKSGYRPDTEDQDGNGSVNLDNDYYEYEIPLDMSQGKNKYVIGNNNHWFQLRIPLADFKRIVGSQDSSFSNISYYRIWFKGVNHLVSVQLHELVLVGSQWTRGSVGLSSTNPIGDSSLRVGYVGIEENAGAPTNYHEPNGVERPRVVGQATAIYGNEQSLDMSLINVPSGGAPGDDQREVQRVFPTPNDIFNYRSLSIFVHGDENTIPATFANAADTNGMVWVYVRFGTDAYNYYEYRRPLRGGWQNIHIDFSKLTSLKAARPASLYRYSLPANDGVPGSLLTVVGSPTLTNAPTFTLGVENRSGAPLTTHIWWDELRLLDANDKADFAYNTSAQLKLAEFGRISGAMVNERPDFHRVDERFNYGRSLNLTWNVTGEFALEKLLPKWMEDKQTHLPITIAHSESILRPKYITNTDIDLNDAISEIQSRMSAGSIAQQFGQYIIDSLRLSNETMRIRNSFGASNIELRFPGSFFLIPAFINRLNFGFGYGEEFLRSPQFEYNRNWSWTASAKYSLPALPNWSVSPFSWIGNTTVLVGPYTGWKITPFPSQVAFAISATRGRTHWLNRLSTLTLPPEGSSYQDTLDVVRSNVATINRIFTTTRGMSVNWKPFEGGFLSPGFDYALDVSSNLAPLETTVKYNRDSVDANGNPIFNYDSLYYFQRAFSDIMHDVFLKNGALVRLGQDYNASQKLHMSTTPRLPGLFGLEKLVRPLFDYRVEYRWQNSQTNEQISKQAAWNNTISTGLELNLRDLGVMIFGKPLGDEAQGPQRGRGERGISPRGPVVPEEPQQRGIEERESPGPATQGTLRNQVDRSEEMRPQAQPNVLGRNGYITDTLHLTMTAPNRVDTNGKVHIRGVGTAGERDQEYAVDTVLTPVAPVEEKAPVLVEEKPAPTLKEIAQKYIQKPLFDWNGTRFNFTQTNQSLNGALQGDGSGITNFLARGIFAPEDDQNGPSRAYQLGLITDPHGRLLVHFTPKFPFVEFGVRHGLRASDPFGRSSEITDVFTQQNNFELTTSRPLWEGASINLNWKLGFGFDERNTLRIDSAGGINPLYVAKSGDVSRTFLSIPPLPFLNISRSGILRVGELYNQKVNEEANARGINPARAQDSLPPDVLNRVEREAFMQGFETLPFFNSFLREYLPRLNYSFSWSGLEKFPLFSFADRASVRHAYNGTYRRSFRQAPGDSLNLTALQTVIYGFRPLIALDMSWDKLMKGRLTTSLNYDTQTEWAADYASTRITKRLSTTVGFTANYQRQGLQIPFLKLDLKNEFGASFTFSQTISADNYYNFWTIDPNNPDGISNGGLTKTTIEPRISYTMSQQLTVEGFYRYERTTPAASGQISPPTRLIMAGVDVRLKIQ